MLELPHFHTKLRQPLNRKDAIKNCLAEYLFPDTKFALGVVYSKGTQPQDLQPYQNKSLQFSSGKRMYFADHSVGEKLYPTPSDRSAYGSLPFTPCQSLQEVTTKVLIIDDETGENGQLFSQNQAKAWVGDCFGRISKSLCDELTQQQKRPFQFRLGIKPQSQCPLYRIAKGTLAPTNLDSLIPAEGIDLVLPTSSFKGRKGTDAIIPGLYTLTVGIGVKTLARYRQHSLGTQVLVNYPHGVKKDILPRIQEQARQLMIAQQDIYELANYYVQTFERQQGSKEHTEVEDWEILFDKAFGQQISDEQDNIILYHLIKQDLDNHCQLLEHPKIIAQLQQFVRRQWLDIATGRSIKFQSGLAQPSLELPENQVWIPQLPAGIEVIVSRAPLLNSNGVIVLINQRLQDSTGKEGTVYINPQTAAKELQGDFDGDFLFFAPADDYPTLTVDIKYALKPRNRYPDVVKPKKQPYQGSFTEIACYAQHNDIGIIANQIQRAIALRWEVQFLSPQHLQSYLKMVQKHYRGLNSQNLHPQWQPAWKQIGNLPERMNSKQQEDAKNLVGGLLFAVIGTLSNQLQIAADGPKSMMRPDELVLAYCVHLSGYRHVGWIREKKREDAYAPEAIKSTNNSPIDWMIKEANRHYEHCVLTPQPLITFRNLFEGVDYTPTHQKQAQRIKEEYNALAAEANQLQHKLKYDKEPFLKVVPSPSHSFIVHNILDYADFNEEVWKKKQLNVSVIANNENRDFLQAIAVSSQGKRLYPIGTIFPDCKEQYYYLCGRTFINVSIIIDKGVTDTEVKAQWKKLAVYRENVRQNLDEEDLLPVAAALWHLSHPRKQQLSGKACAVMAIFPDLIAQRLEKRQLNLVKVVGIHQPTNVYKSTFWQGEEVFIGVAEDNNPDSPLYQKRVVTVNKQVLAPFTAESPRLPIGTTGKGYIFTQPGAKITATSSRGNTLTLKRAQHYSSYQWQQEEAELVVKRCDNAWVLCCEDKPIGELDAQSVHKLKRHRILREGKVLSLTLESSTPTSAVIELIPDTLNYHQNLQQTVSATRNLLSEPTVF